MKHYFNQSNTFSAMKNNIFSNTYCGTKRIDYTSGILVHSKPCNASNLTFSRSCRLTSCRDPTRPAAPSDDHSSEAGWSSLSCRLKAFGWFLQCSRPNGTNDCNSPAAIIVAVSSYTTSDMSSRYQHYF